MSASTKSSIKCQAMEHIRGYGSPRKWNVRFSKDHGIAVVNCGSDSLFIYDKESKKLGTLKFPGQCHCHDLVSHQGLCSLVCGLQDGRIFSCSLQEWCHQKKKKKHKSKSKNKAGSTSSESKAAVAGDQGLNEGKWEKRRFDGEDDIFRDLLGGGDRSGSATKDSTKDPTNILYQEFMQAVDPVTKVDEQKIILRVDNLESFVMVSDSLVTCSREGIGWRVSVHSCQLNKDSFTCVKNPLYSTLIFGADDTIPRGQASFQNPGVETKDEVEATVGVGVYGLMSSSSHGNSDVTMQSCGILVTSDALFNAMWGSEANLVDSPVIVITLPDGCVYSITLKSFLSTSFSSAKSIRLLCRSLEPVIQVCITSYSIQSNLAGSSLNCLVLIGAGGQLMTFYEDPSDSNSTEISRLHTSSPIAAALVTKDTLICASNFDLKFITFHLRDTVLQMSMSSCSMPGIASVALLKGTSSSYKFLAIKKNGTVLQLLLPSEHTADSDQAGISSTAARQRVHEALRNMREVSSKMAALTRLGSRQRAVLEELSSAHHIVCQTWEASGAFELETRVECFFENGQKSTKVFCKVTNCTSWTISHGWTLIGTLLSDCQERSKVNRTKYHRTRSTPLVGFAPKTAVMLSFVLDESGCAESWPLTVQCSLCFDLSALLEDIPVKEDLGKTVESSVALDGEVKGAVFPIGSSEVDILDSLQERVRCSTGLERRNQRHDWTKAILSRSSESSNPHRQVSAASQSQMASATIRLDRNLLSRPSNVADSSRVLTEQVLQWLLPTNQSVVIKDSCIEAVTPCGCLVSIQALEQNGEVSLQITSSDEEITRALIEAIHRRIKNSKLVSAEFRVDCEKMKKEASSVKIHLGKLLSISDQLTSAKSREDLTILAKELMHLHGDMRRQITIH
ncbi:uncharacterized protein LOC121411696 [Lytechinus variegatus]|uniref:uncharacterized protein LOC121411696 n=1 Tax=Lytechinus variegatus TaxID=7654 RepID=UPI001BB1C96C|nr:uncharacterized protein LOC121411696 [Lytechinus variegatus]